MTISGGRTKQLDIFCHVTGFTSDFLSFIVVELIQFFHGAIQFSIKATVHGKLLQLSLSDTSKNSIKSCCILMVRVHQQNQVIRRWSHPAAPKIHQNLKWLLFKLSCSQTDQQRQKQNTLGGRNNGNMDVYCMCKWYTCIQCLVTGHHHVLIFVHRKAAVPVLLLW